MSAASAAADPAAAAASEPPNRAAMERFVSRSQALVDERIALCVYQVVILGCNGDAIVGEDGTEKKVVLSASEGTKVILNYLPLPVLTQVYNIICSREKALQQKGK